jgi:hypothetical protein
MKPLMHVRRSLNALAVGLWIGVGCAGCRSSPPSTPDVLAQVANEQSKAEVRVELETYYRDLSARRWNAFASHFWPGATITTIWQPRGEPRERVYVQSVEEFIAQTPEGPDSKPIFSEKMLSAEIRVEAGLAHAWARYEAEFGQPGDIAKWTGTDAFTLMKFNGQWRIIALAFAPE